MAAYAVQLTLRYRDLAILSLISTRSNTLLFTLHQFLFVHCFGFYFFQKYHIIHSLWSQKPEDAYNFQLPNLCPLLKQHLCFMMLLLNIWTVTYFLAHIHSDFWVSAIQEVRWYLLFFSKLPNYSHHFSVSHQASLSRSTERMHPAWQWGCQMRITVLIEAPRDIHWFINQWKPCDMRSLCSFCIFLGSHRC